MTDITPAETLEHYMYWWCHMLVNSGSALTGIEGCIEEISAEVAEDKWNCFQHEWDSPVTLHYAEAAR